MIAACYDLQLYCDNPGCTHGRFNERGHAEYTDELGSTCRRNARRNGWWIDMKTGCCACPPCARSGARPTEPRLT